MEGIKYEYHSDMSSHDWSKIAVDHAMGSDWLTGCVNVMRNADWSIRRGNNVTKVRSVHIHKDRVQLTYPYIAVNQIDYIKSKQHRIIPTALHILLTCYNNWDLLTIDDICHHYFLK